MDPCFLNDKYAVYEHCNAIKLLLMNLIINHHIYAVNKQTYRVCH